MTQFKTVLEVVTPTDEYTLVGRPCELSGFSFIPPQRKDPPERTYFNSRFNHGQNKVGSGD